MKLSLVRPLAAAVAGAVLSALAVGAEAGRSASPIGSRSTGATRPGTPARGVLPDPVLLDGSKHAAEKKSDYGMVGDFELPGDENAPKGKVGGGGGPEGQPPNGEGGQQGAGGGGAKPDLAGKQGGGKDGSQTAKAAGGGPEGKEGSGAAKAAAGEQGASAQGIQVAELGGDPSVAAGPEGMQKPPSVAIGDKAMRIPQSAQSTAGVVGAQQVASQNTQVYEKGTGTGGKAPTGQQGPNRTEKGRVIPPGL